MRSALRILVLLASLFLVSPAAARRLDVGDACRRVLASDDALARALPALDAAPFQLVRLSAPPPFAESALWDVVGGPPSLPLSRDDAVVLVARLAQTGLFSAIEPRAADGELEIALSPNPLVRSVQVRGLSEFRTEDVVDRLLDAPGDREVERRQRELPKARHECLAPLPPPLWLARRDGDEVRAGVVWQGLRGGLSRVLRYLRTRGYPLARIQGALSASGDLTLEVDEGRVGAVEVRGLEPHLALDVARELNIRSGDVFSSGELYAALDRVERKWPFVRPDRRSGDSQPQPVLQIDERPGAVEFHSELPSAPPLPSRSDDDDDFFSDEPAPSRRFHPRRIESSARWYGFDGDTLVVQLRTDRSRTKMHWMELFRHTPVTGFAPGLAATLTVFDPADQIHLMLDGAFNINTRRPSLDATGGTFLQRLNAQERVDWLAGPRLRIPGLDIAELGGQIHTLTDTADAWRIDNADSYFYSAVINRADREYFRRSGYSAFLTTHFFDELTLGAEYRRDRYAALPAPAGVWTVWNKYDPVYGAAEVEEGEMGSVVARMEYHSEKAPLHRVGSMWHSPETSLVAQDPRPIGLRTLDTVEVADPALGGQFKFTRVVSDTFITLETSRSATLTLRLRAAGGKDLPLQKQEGLGGWTALRGYDFKEFRGNGSVLATLQAEGRHFGAFLDVGSVHQGSAGWIDPKPSAGALFYFGDDRTRAEVAWRLDGRARLLPDFRVLFGVPL